MGLERPVFARRFVQFEARFKTNKEKGTTIRSRSTSEETNNTRKETEKEIPNGKDPKVPIRQESRISLYDTIFRRRKAKRNPHRDYWHPPECAHTMSPEVDGNGRIRVDSNTQAKLVETKA